MARHVRFWAVVQLIAFSCLAVAAEVPPGGVKSAGGDSSAWQLADDEACGAAAGGECSLSLRQLRVTGVLGHGPSTPEEAQGASDPQRGDPIDDAGTMADSLNKAAEREAAQGMGGGLDIAAAMTDSLNAAAEQEAEGAPEGAGGGLHDATADSLNAALELEADLPEQAADILATHDAEGGMATVEADGGSTREIFDEGMPEETMFKAEGDGAGGMDVFADGVPGGWGEAEEVLAAAEKETMGQSDEANMSGGKELEGFSWGGGSCAQYKCENYHRKWLPCQCNYHCRYHGNCCGDYWSRCANSARRRHRRREPPRRRAPPPPPPTTTTTTAAPPKPGPQDDQGNMTLYHQTGVNIGPLILANGFRPGTRGWCGGGIYFATSPAGTHTKAIGADSHKGFLIEAVVDVGFVKNMSATCDTEMTDKKLASWGYDSISFDPGDGVEYIVYNEVRVLSTRQVPMR